MLTFTACQSSLINLPSYFIAVNRVEQLIIVELPIVPIHPLYTKVYWYYFNYTCIGGLIITIGYVPCCSVEIKLNTLLCVCVSPISLPIHIPEDFLLCVFSVFNPPCATLSPSPPPPRQRSNFHKTQHL